MDAKGGFIIPKHLEDCVGKLIIPAGFNLRQSTTATNTVLRAVAAT